MTPKALNRASDPMRPLSASPVTITVDGEAVTGVTGQSIAGVVLANDVLRLRDTATGASRSVFCGIGVCFDCLVTVNGVPDVRACQRIARPGDDVRTTAERPDDRADR